MLLPGVPSTKCRKASGEVPEVISMGSDLVADASARLSFRMRSARVLSELTPTPLSLAGYLVWVTVAIGLWREMAHGKPLEWTTARAIAVVSMLFFLAGFGLRARGFAEHARDARNFASLILMITSALALLALGPSTFTPILLVVIAVAIGAIFPPRAAVMALVLLNLAFLVVLMTRWANDGPGFVLFIYGVFQAFALLTTLDRMQAQRISRELREVNAQLLATRELLAESARDGERLRVSRELHDVAGHRLTALALNLELLGQGAGIAQQREWLVSRDLVTELLSDLRSVVASLRRHDGIDVREALRRIADAFPAPRIHLDLDELVRVDGADKAEVIVRAGQEGLTNAVRHANAGNIWLSLNQDAVTLRLEVRDDGASSGALSTGYGLLGLQERVELLGGRVETDRSPEGGFRLRVTLPTERQP
jgi:signal transduction histidine kinase